MRVPVELWRMGSQTGAKGGRVVTTGEALTAVLERTRERETAFHAGGSGHTGERARLVSTGVETLVVLLDGEERGFTHCGPKGDHVRTLMAHGQRLMPRRALGLEDASRGVERGLG